MAYLEMSEAVNMADLNLNRLYSNAWDWGLLNNVYTTLYGDTYEDIYAVDWSSGGIFLGSIFGGYGMTTDSRNYPTGGTTTGYLETVFNSQSGYVPYFGIRDTSVPTVDIWNAAVTPDTTDDYVLIRQMLAGNDTLVGSPFNDDIYGYAGNDTINASGGSDIVVGGDGTDTYVVTGVTSNSISLAQQEGVYVVTSSRFGTDFLIDVENISLSDGVFSLASFFGDRTPPTISLQTQSPTIYRDGTAEISFRLSESATDFNISDIYVTGGSITSFSGSGETYTATFTPDSDGSNRGSISVPSNSFSDSSGNYNVDGLDLNNVITITINESQGAEQSGEIVPSEPSIPQNDTQDAESNSLTLIANVLGSVLFLENLTEVRNELTHTIEYNSNTFNYSDVDSMVTTVVRNGDFTAEFAAEIAESFPDSAGISYATALTLIGQANIEATLLAVAGADGNYIG